MDALQVIEYQNRRIREPFDFDFIERAAVDEVTAQLGRPEITVILGPRQAGKTTLLRRLIQARESGGRSGTTLYMNMDSREVRRGFASPTGLASVLESRGMGKGDLLVIDEVQRIDEPGLYLKQLHDLAVGFKIVVSGSSSLEIGSETREHLTGRRRTVTLWPLSFSELAAHEHLDSGPARLSPALDEALSGLLERLAVHGGYPAVWNERDPVEKAGVIASIYDTYITRDVVEFLGVRNAVGFNDLVRALAGQVGGLVSWASLSQLAGIDVRTVRSYVGILEQTYVIRCLRPYSTNPRKEIRKSPKCPFADNGLMNAAGGDLSPLAHRSDPGPLIENLVISEVAKTTDATLRYWRTTAGAEVDLLVQHPDRLVPIEVKSTALRRPSMSRGFRSFLGKYSPKRALVLHRGARLQEKTGSTVIDFLPVHQALLGRPWE
jgi:predicted AAA+ superfamily ATPase